MAWLTPLTVMAGLTAILASLLALAHHFLHVIEDPRIEVVGNSLPQTNCGGCGFPGCHAFATALVAGEVQPGLCHVATGEQRQAIASYLRIELGVAERVVARLACAGGSNVARIHAHYQGVTSCAAATVLAGGGKGCFWGCLGYGDCQHACTFNAIDMNGHRLPVVSAQRCTGCGDCVTACPKDLFSLESISRKLWVACRSQAAGDEILQDCEVACTACERCAQDAPQVIRMEHNLPVIDESCVRATRDATQSCPTGAIVWLDEERGPLKGQAARKVHRQGVISDAPT